MQYSLRLPGPIETSIVEKLQRGLQPLELAIFNDSSKHAGHHGLRGAANTTESHFRVVVVSEKFRQCKNQPGRHRLVYGLLQEEINEKGVHALQLKTKTPEEVAGKEIGQ